MREIRYCGICEEKNPYKDICWKCAERGARLSRAIQKKLQAKRQEGSK